MTDGPADLAAPQGGASPQALRVLILGAGAVTRIFYVPALLRGLSRLTLAGVVDRSESALRQLGPLPASVQCLAVDAAAALADRDLLAGVDLAVIALPHALHEAAVIQSLRAGLHVFSEKPLGLSVAEVQRMMAAARETGRLLTVCQPRRSLPAVVAIASMLRTGALGQIRRVAWDEGQPYAWPAQSLSQVRLSVGGSELHDIGAHAFDVLCQWFGPLDVERYADDGLGGTPAEFEVDLMGEGGLPVAVRLSRLRHLAQRVTIVGERGCLVWPLARTDALLLQGCQGLGLHSAEIRLPSQGQPASIYDAVRHQLEAFGRAAAGAGALPNPAESALGYVRIFDQCAAARCSQPVRSAVLQTGDHYVVVGAAGFIGCALVEALLLRGHRVTALVHRPASAVRLLRRDVQVELCDVARPETYRAHIQAGSIVINCAVSHSGDDLDRVVVRGALALLDTAQSQGARRVVLLSSMMAYGDPPSDGVVTEATAQAPSQMRYAHAKAEMERGCQQWAATHTMPVVILQPTCVYGPWGKDFGAAPLDEMRAGTFFLFEEGRATANLVYVENLLDAILLASERPLASGSRYIVNEDGEQTTWAAFYGALGEAAFNLAPRSFPSIRRDELAALCARWRKRHGFPDVLREAVRASPIATDWLAEQRWFKVWRRMRDGSRQAAAPPSSGTGLPPAPLDVHDSGRRALHERLLAQRRLFVNESTGRFFTSGALYSSARIRADLGWTPRVSRAVALQATARWAARAYEYRQPDTASKG